MRVIVTGAAGYIGSLLCHTLIFSGHEVTAVDNLMYGQQSLFGLCGQPRFNFIRADISDINYEPETGGPLTTLIEESDVVVHLAAIVGADACNAALSLSNDVNYYATADIANILQSAVEETGSRKLLIFPNTNSGYGVMEQADIYTEESPLNPVSAYGQQKVEAEYSVLRTDWPIKPLYDYVVLRLATVFGPSPRMRTDLLVNNFVYQAVKSRCITVFQGHCRRNFVEIHNVVECINHFVDAYSKIPDCTDPKAAGFNEVYNFGNDDLNMTKLELANRIAELIPGTKVIEVKGAEDPDKRDYLVSNAKIASVYKPYYRGLEDAVGGLVNLYKMMGPGSTRNA